MRLRLVPRLPLPVATFGLLSASMLAAPLARANGRFPTAQQLAPSPTDPTFLPMMATFGAVVSKDEGATWGWVCEGAVGYASNENPTLGVMANNNVLVAAFEGLGITTDRGCTWTLGVGGITDNARDLVVEPSDAHSALVLTSAYVALGDAGPTYDTRIWVTHDDGATFTQVGQSLDPDIISQTIDVAPSDPTRVYVSGTRSVAGVPSGVLLRSLDGGKTFTETDFPLVSGDAGLIDRAPYIAAVDPTNPDRVYVRVDNIDGTRVLVSDDGLKTTRQVWQAAGQLLGFVVSADGTKIYAGGPNDGLYVASSAALTFTNKVWPGQVECLALKGATLLACSNEVSGFAVGASADDGATWTPLLHLSCVQGPLACAASSAVTTQCGPLWAAQQETLGGVCTRGDAGTDGGGGGTDAGGIPSDAGDTAPAPSKGGGCSAAAASARGPGMLAAGVGIASLVALAQGRRRRRRETGGSA